MRRVVGAVAGTAVLLMALVTPSGAAGRSEQPRARTAAGAVSLADTDGDGLSDALAHRLRGRDGAAAIDVVVSLRGNGTAAALQRAVGRFAVRRQFALVRGIAATVTTDQARALARVPGVRRVEEDFAVSTTMSGAREDFGITAAREQFGVSGAGVEICVIDTGIDPAHEQFDSRSIPFFDAIAARTVPYDDQGHGTHVAAIAAGDGTGTPDAVTYQGVAPAAALAVAKVLDAQGSGTESQVIAGVEWCADRPSTRIISMSLGSSASSDGQDTMSMAVDAAVAAGKIVVVAAGNSGDTPGTVGSPGAAAQALTVGAVADWSSASGATLAPFSSRGPTADGRVKPDVAAPGVAITAAQAGTTTGYVTYSGTSMATPFVSGTVALMLQRNGALTGADVRDQVAATAEPHGDAGADNDWGAGLLDGLGAVAAADGTVAQGSFPTTETISGSVADFGVYRRSITVNDTTLPLAVTMLNKGALTCTLFAIGFCWAYEWSPDLELRVLAPDGTQLAASECPAYGNCAGVGHQETISVRPAVTGTYTLEVWPYGGEPNNGRGGAFTLDISQGPLVTGTTHEQPPGGDPSPDPPGYTAVSDQAVLGSVTGSFVDTTAADDVTQTVTEAAKGKGRNRSSGLEHRWTFSVPDTGTWALHVDASAIAFTATDGVQLSYNVGGKKWYPLGRVGSAMSFAMGSFSGGSVQIRAADVDRPPGVVSGGVLAADHLVIRRASP